MTGREIKVKNSNKGLNSRQLARGRGLQRNSHKETKDKTDKMQRDSLMVDRRLLRAPGVSHQKHSKKSLQRLMHRNLGRSKGKPWLL